MMESLNGVDHEPFVNEEMTAEFEEMIDLELKKFLGGFGYKQESQDEKKC